MCGVALPRSDVIKALKDSAESRQKVTLNVVSAGGARGVGAAVGTALRSVAQTPYVKVTLNVSPGQQIGLGGE